MINDVSELVVEAARISGRTDLPQIAPMLLGFLEGYLNNTLRTDGMVASASLTTDADGVVALPTDYLEAVSLEYGSDVHLSRITRAKADVGVAGYYIAGGNLVSSKVGTAHALNYYQSIPGLWSNSTNWLLTAKPEIYLRGLVFEAHKDANDAEAAMQAKMLLDMAVDDLNTSDVRARRSDAVSMVGTQI